MIVKPCLTCQRPTRHGSRCPACAQQHELSHPRQQASAHDRGYTREWQRMVRQAIAEQPWCSRCMATTNLQGDHIVPLSRGGATAVHNVQVLCQRCNAQKGGVRRSAPRPQGRAQRSNRFVQRYRSREARQRTAVVHIIGAPATGKSHLSAIIAEALGIPSYGIDAERLAILPLGTPWPADETTPWCRLEDHIDAQPLCVVETSGLHGNDLLLLAYRRVLRILCTASDEVRRARLEERTRDGYTLALGREDYVRRLMRVPRPTVPADLTLDTTHGSQPEATAALLAAVRQFAHA